MLPFPPPAIAHRGCHGRVILQGVQGQGLGRNWRKWSTANIILSSENVCFNVYAPQCAMLRHTTTCIQGERERRFVHSTRERATFAKEGAQPLSPSCHSKAPFSLSSPFLPSIDYTGLWLWLSLPSGPKLALPERPNVGARLLAGHARKSADPSKPCGSRACDEKTRRRRLQKTERTLI